MKAKFCIACLVVSMICAHLAIAQKSIPVVIFPDPECSGQECLDAFFADGDEEALKRCLQDVNSRCPNGRPAPNPVPVPVFPPMIPDNDDEPREPGVINLPLVTHGVPCGGDRYCGLSLNKSELRRGMLQINKGRLIPGTCRFRDSLSVFKKFIGPEMTSGLSNCLDFIPVFYLDLKKKNAAKYIDSTSALPFRVYNFLDLYFQFGDFPFHCTHEYLQGNASTICTNHRPWQFHNPECTNFEKFCKANKDTPLIQSNYPLFSLNHIIPLKDGVYLTSGFGSMKLLEQVRKEWFFESNWRANTIPFLYNLAICLANDPDLEIKMEDLSGDNPYALVSGKAERKIDGKITECHYIALVTHEGLFSPVDCGDLKETSDLVELLLKSYSRSKRFHPLNIVISKYLLGGGNGDICIRAYVPDNVTINPNDPGAAMKSIDNSIRKHKSLDKALLLVGYEIMGDTGQVIGRIDESIGEIGNKHILRYAIKVPSVKVLYEDRPEFMWVIGIEDGQSSYVLQECSRGAIPLSVDMFGGHDLFDQRELLSKKYFHSPEMIVRDMLGHLSTIRLCK